jgi:hypothetical protein
VGDMNSGGKQNSEFRYRRRKEKWNRVFIDHIRIIK